MEHFGDFIFNTPQSQGSEYAPEVPLPPQTDPSTANPSPPTEGTEAQGPAPELLNSDIFKVHFAKKNRREDPDGTIRWDVCCNYCPIVYAFKKGGGYDTFRLHLEKKHPEKIGLLVSQSQLAGFVQRPETSTQGNRPRLFNYNQSDAIYGLGESICVDQLAFNFAENVGLNDWIPNYVQPAYKPTTRKTVKKCILKAYSNRKKALIKFFGENDVHVSICSDIWSDHWQEHSYMGITCHFINDRFELEKRVLAFRLFDDVHSASHISVAIQ